jgi:poly(A) polymerase
MNAAEHALSVQADRTSIPRRFSAVTRQIWVMQNRFTKTRGKRWKRLLHEQRFRAAYDFLLLRAEEDESLKPLCEFWTEAQKHVPQDSADQQRKNARRRRPRRRVRRRPGTAGQA